MSWYGKCIKNYVNFSGRARRKEYWLFFLFNTIFAVVAMILDSILGLSYKMQGISLGYGIIYTLYALFALLPSLAVFFRRLHDQDKSGWWIFISLVPLIGGIWLLVLMCTEGTLGANRYGEDSKAVDAGGAGVAV